MVIKHNLTVGLKTSAYPKTSDEEQEYPIRIRITYHGTRLDYPIRLAIAKSYWDNKSQRVISGRTNSKGISSSDINSTISEYITIIEDIIKSFEIQKVIPSPEILREAISKSFANKFIDLTGSHKPQIDVNTAFQMFVNERGEKNSWTKATYEKMDALFTDLMTFNKKLKFSDFTEEGLNNFLIFLRDKKELKRNKKTDTPEKPSEKEIGLKNSTIGKKFDFLKWFLKWATNKGYNTCLDYQEYKPKLKTTNNTVVFLTLDEIKKLCDYPIPPEKQTLERVRDGFVFCCFTGLRYSDLKNLKKTDVKDTIIDITTLKTSDTLHIDFNHVSKQIISKYKNCPTQDNCAIPTISNQKMNDALKELCKLAEIDSPVRKVYFKGNERIEETKPKYEYVGTHTGRRSFICNALASGLGINTIMQITGHKKYEAMRPYIAIADEIRAKEMMKMDKFEITIK